MGWKEPIAYQVSSYIIPASDFHQHTPPPEAQFLNPGPTKEQLDRTGEELKTIGGFIPGLDIGIEGYDAVNEYQQSNYIQAGLSGLSLIPGADFITKPLKQLLKNADQVKDLVQAAGKIKKADGKLGKETIAHPRCRAEHLLLR